MRLKKQKKSIAALYLDGDTLEITCYKGGAFHSKKIVGEVALQRLELDRKVQGAQIVTALGGAELLFRTLELPLREKRAIHKALPFQLENLIPFPPDEALVLPLLRRKGRKKTKVEIFATQKKNLEKHLRSWRQLFVEPEFVTAYIQGLWRFLQKIGQKEVTLLHLGASESYLLLVRGEELQAAIALKLGSNSPESEIKKELYRAFHFFGEDLPPLLITGNPYPKIRELITTLVDKVSWVCDETIQEKAPFALTIGLALDAAAQDHNTLQFRLGEYAPISQVAKVKKKFVLFASCLLLYLLVFSLVGRGVVQRKERVLKKRKEEISLLCKKKLNTTPNFLNKVDVGTAIEAPAPLVSDLLAYLAALPELQEGIEIKKVHYILLQYPTVEQPKIRYEAEVHLEVFANSSEIANKFYEKIRKEKEKVRWQRHENSYQITFAYT